MDAFNGPCGAKFKQLYEFIHFTKMTQEDSEDGRAPTTSEILATPEGRGLWKDFKICSTTDKESIELKKKVYEKESVGPCSETFLNLMKVDKTLHETDELQPTILITYRQSFVDYLYCTYEKKDIYKQLYTVEGDHEIDL